MANTVTSQVILDGDKNVVVLLTGLLDTSNEARVVKVDVSTLTPRPTKLKVNKISCLISQGLIVILDWDATTPVRFAALTYGDEIEFDCFGGLPNNAGAGVTGSIALTTAGWSSGTASYTILLEMQKVSF